jgi:hypothetical protein
MASLPPKGVKSKKPRKINGDERREIQDERVEK